MRATHLLGYGDQRVCGVAVHDAGDGCVLLSRGVPQPVRPRWHDRQPRMPRPGRTMRVLTTVMGQNTTAAVARDTAPSVKVRRAGRDGRPSESFGQLCSNVFCALLRQRK